MTTSHKSPKWIEVKRRYGGGSETLPRREGSRGVKCCKGCLAGGRSFDLAATTKTPTSRSLEEDLEEKEVH